MNREQAIKIIKDCKEKSFKRTLYTLNEYYEAVDMAIQALEQQPCEDAISRQAAINIVRCDVLSAAIIYGRTEEGMSARKAIVNGLKRLPSVSTEKTGRWEKLNVGYGCSECSLCTNKRGIYFYRYCPNCGAKMGVEK